EAQEAPPPVRVLALPEKPSLVVLPFQNMTGDTDQEYFVDGMVEGITTAISRVPWLFVISRNSAFTYVGRISFSAARKNDLSGIRTSCARALIRKIVSPPTSKASALALFGLISGTWDDAAIFVDLGVLYVCSDRRRDGGRQLINPSVDARPQNAGPDVKHLTAQFLFGQPLGLQPKPPHGRIDCNATIPAPARAGTRSSRARAAPSLKKSTEKIAQNRD